MAKCTNCGKKRLFLRVNERGLCQDCAATDKRRREIEQLNLQAANIEKRANAADELLQEAVNAAKTEAHRLLEEQHRTLNTEVAELTARLADLHVRADQLNEENIKTSKKLATAQNRIAKAKPVYNSMQYAMDAFMNPASDRASLASMLSTDLYEILDREPDLKCLTMKSLKALYKQNEKKILEVTTSYQGQYTTKANAAIYKLMVLALNAEMTVIMENLSFGKLDDALEKVKGVTSQYYAIAAEGNQSIVNTLNRYIGQIEYLYMEAVKIEYEYYIQRERAKEEQRAIREQMRQEAEERKQLEIERKQVENEEKKYQQEIDRIRQRIESAKDDEIAQLKNRLAELSEQMQAVNEKKEEIIKLQNGKAGTVYIISNIGSFGDDVFKIGMTRRTEPQERVNELGDASVPFPFDVHSFIFSDDAVALENALHKELNNRRVNKVNLRKEFFRVSLDDLETMVNRIDPSAPFQRTILAEQYRQSQSIDVPTDEQIEIALSDE